MLKLVLNEYRCRFWMMLQAQIGKFILFLWWTYFYDMFMMRLNIMKYSLGMLPLLLGFFLSRMFPNQLSKLLFLCPISKQDRKKYLIMAYKMRIGISIFLYLALSMFAVNIEEMSLSEYIGISLLVLSFNLGVNMHHALLSFNNVRMKGEKDYKLSFAYGILSLLTQFMAWIAMIFFASIGKHGMEQHTDDVILFIMVFFEVLLNMAICVICYRPVMQYGMNYESCRTVYSKDKKE